MCGHNDWRELVIWAYFTKGRSAQAGQLTRLRSHNQTWFMLKLNYWFKHCFLCKIMHDEKPILVCKWYLWSRSYWSLLGLVFSCRCVYTLKAHSIVELYIVLTIYSPFFLYPSLKKKQKTSNKNTFRSFEEVRYKYDSFSRIYAVCIIVRLLLDQGG